MLLSLPSAYVAFSPFRQQQSTQPSTQSPSHAPTCREMQVYASAAAGATLQQGPHSCHTPNPRQSCEISLPSHIEQSTKHSSQLQSAPPPPNPHPPPQHCPLPMQPVATPPPAVKKWIFATPPLRRTGRFSFSKPPLRYAVVTSSQRLVSTHSNACIQASSTHLQGYAAACQCSSSNKAGA
jgi:hypothetical protein